MQDAKNGKPRAMRLMLGSGPWLKELSWGGNGEFRFNGGPRFTSIRSSV